MRRKTWGEKMRRKMRGKKRRKKWGEKMKKMRGKMRGKMRRKSEEKKRKKSEEILQTLSFQRRPPILAIICMATFVATLFSFFGSSTVLDSITWVMPENKHCILKKTLSKNKKMEQYCQRLSQIFTRCSARELVLEGAVPVHGIVGKNGHHL